MRLELLVLLGSAVLGLASPALERRNEPIGSGQAGAPKLPDYRLDPNGYEARFTAHENEVLKLNLEENEFAKFMRCVESEVCMPPMMAPSTGGRCGRPQQRN